MPGRRSGIYNSLPHPNQIEDTRISAEVQTRYWSKSDQDLGNVADRSDAANLAPQGVGTGYLARIAQYHARVKLRLPVSKSRKHGAK